MISIHTHSLCEEQEVLQGLILLDLRNKRVVTFPIYEDTPEPEEAHLVFLAEFDPRITRRGMEAVQKFLQQTDSQDALQTVLEDLFLGPNLEVYFGEEASGCLSDLEAGLALALTEAERLESAEDFFEDQEEHILDELSQLYCSREALESFVEKQVMLAGLGGIVLDQVETKDFLKNLVRQRSEASESLQTARWDSCSGDLDFMYPEEERDYQLSFLWEKIK